MGKLFGTDGARGVAGKDLTPELAMQIGRAAAAVLAGKTQHRPRFIIGKDTRISGDMLESALAAGLCSVGADVELLGVIPTPAVAHLVRKYGAIANPKFKETFHYKAKMVNPEKAEELVGHAVGGVCPFDVNNGCKIYLDESIRLHE